MGTDSLLRTAVFGRNRIDRADDALVVVNRDLVRLDRHPAAVYLAALAPGSRRTMRAALRIIAGLVVPDADEVTFPWASLDYAHTTAIRTKLAERFAPATANRMLAALRGTIRSAFRLGLIEADQMARACDIDAVRGARLPRGRALSQGELRGLFDACDPATPVGARDAALLAMLYAGGLRRAEVVAIDLADLDATTGGLIIKGKGNKQRRIFVASGARAALDAWLAHRGDEPGPLLLPVLKGGTITARRMSDQAVAERLCHLGSRAKLAHFSAHDFRRTFVGDLLDAGADIATVQAMAGHASPVTTSKYDRRGDRAQARAAGLLHVPFGLPTGGKS